MELLEYVKENEKLILSFDDYISKNKTNYQVISALNALDITNEAQEQFVSTMKTSHTDGQRILRLYGLLQGLFVSIDSLYALTYCLTKSKNHININQNESLRELKYIRNDVVGHPSNRVYEDSVLGYCILKKENIFDSTFSYTIHINGNVKEKEVDLNNLLINYYIEANKVLKTIKDIENSDLSKTNTVILGTELFDSFYYDLDYSSVLKRIRDAFTDRKLINKSENRILWRIDLLDKLDKFKVESEFEIELRKAAIAFQIEKICELLNGGITLPAKPKRKLPKYLSSLFRFFHQHPELEYAISYMYDATHPLFLASINRVKSTAIKYSSFYVVDYMDLLLKLFKTNEFDLVYTLAILAKKFQKKA